MLPSHHAAATAAAFLPLARRGWSPAALVGFAAAAVLIDGDHYLSYVWKTGDLSLLRAYWYHRARTPPWRWRGQLRWPTLGWQETRPFHALPLLLLLLAAGRYWPRLRPLAWGALFHRLLDAVWEAISPERDGRRRAEAALPQSATTGAATVRVGKEKDGKPKRRAGLPGVGVQVFRCSGVQVFSRPNT